jgi:perosamine synthetase
LYQDLPQGDSQFGKEEQKVDQQIPVFKPYYDQLEIDAAAAVIKTGWTGLGPKTEEFEKKFCEKLFTSNGHVGKKAVGLNSATAALDMALKLLGVNHGDEVLVPSITFVSTAHVVEYNLAKPVFVDVDPETLNIDLKDVERKITKKTKAIIPVHYAGRAVDVKELMKIADIHPYAPVEDYKQIYVVEDCAHACGAKLYGKNLPYGDVGCFSFHAVKNLSMGEGGALVLPEGYASWEDMHARAKRLRWLGIDKNTWERTDNNKSYWWEYSVDEIGLKSHMDDIHAAIGLVQLEKLEESNRLRAERVQWYREGLTFLEDQELVDLPPEETRENSVCSWHLFCIQCKHRDELSVFLKERGIMTGVHYKPIHLYKCYGNTPHLPVAESLFPKLLTLPLFPDLTKEQVDRICDTIHNFYKGI